MNKGSTAVENPSSHAQVVIEFRCDFAAAMDFVERDPGKVMVLHVIPAASRCGTQHPNTSDFKMRNPT